MIIIATTTLLTLGTTTKINANDDKKGISVGGIILGYHSPFEAENTKPNGDGKVSLNAFPYVSYYGDYFYIDGTEIGMNILSTGKDSDMSFRLDTFVGARMIAGSSRNKLTADGGVKASISGDFGFLGASFLHDITGTHNGTEAKITYGYSFRGDKYSFTPTASLIRMNSKMTNHMYGVSTDQHVKMIENGDPLLPIYNINSTSTNIALEGIFTYDINETITFLSYANVTFLDSVIKNNPGINLNQESSLGFGLVINF